MLLFGDALCGNVFVAGAVVGPWGTGGDPSALHPAHGPVDVEHLEKQLEWCAPDVDPGFERRRGQRAIRGGQRGEHGGCALFAGHRRGGEVVPDRFVFGAGQKQHVGVVGRPPCPADLLVVRDRRGGGTEVHDETEVGFIESHAQRRGRDQRLHLVAFQSALGFFSLGRVGLAGVGAHVVAGIPEQPCGVFGGGDGEGVNDAAAGQVGQVAEQPAEPGARIRESKHAEAQGCPRKRPANGEHGTVPDAELLLDIGDDPGVRCRGGRQHRNTVREFANEVTQPTVVGSKVVAPVADAVRFVNDEQSRPPDE